MFPESWIKQVLAKEANAPGFKRILAEQVFEIVTECQNVGFFTTLDEIPAIICDAHGLQIFAIFTYDQKKQILAKRDFTLTSAPIRLRCLQYKLEVRDIFLKLDPRDELDDTCTPGVNYQIVLVLTGIGNVGVNNPFSETEKHIRNQWLRLWYYEFEECRVYARIIKKNLKAPDAMGNNIRSHDSRTIPSKDNNIAMDEDRLDAGGLIETSPRRSPVIFHDSQEPKWAASGDLIQSQYSQEIPEWASHAKPLNKAAMDVQPSCSRVRTSAEMETYRLNELVNPRALSIGTNILFDQTPSERSSPVIEMAEVELLNVIQNNDVDDVNSSKRLSAGISYVDLTIDDSDVDLTPVADPSTSLLSKTDSDASLTPSQDRNSKIVQTITRRNCEKPEDVIMDQEKGGDFVNVEDILDQADPTEEAVDSADDTNPKNITVLANIAPENMGQKNNTNLATARAVPSRTVASGVNLSQKNLAVADGHRDNGVLTQTFQSDRKVPSAISAEESPKVAIKKQPPSESPHKPMRKKQHDQRSRRNKKIKNRKARIMYRVPDPDLPPELDYWCCHRSNFMEITSDAEAVDEGRTNIPRQSSAESHKTTRHDSVRTLSSIIVMKQKSMNDDRTDIPRQSSAESHKTTRHDSARTQSPIIPMKHKRTNDDRTDIPRQSSAESHMTIRHDSERAPSPVIPMKQKSTNEDKTNVPRQLFAESHKTTRHDSARTQSPIIPMKHKRTNEDRTDIPRQSSGESHKTTRHDSARTSSPIIPMKHKRTNEDRIDIPRQLFAESHKTTKHDSARTPSPIIPMKHKRTNDDRTDIPRQSSAESHKTIRHDSERTPSPVIPMKHKRTNEDRTNVPRQSSAESHKTTRYDSARTQSPIIPIKDKIMAEHAGPEQCQNKKRRANLEISDEYRNLLKKHILSSLHFSDSSEFNIRAQPARIESSENPGTSTNQTRYILVKSTPKTLDVSPEHRRALMRHIFKDYNN